MILNNESNQETKLEFLSFQKLQNKLNTKKKKIPEFLYKLFQIGEKIKTVF